MRRVIAFILAFVFSLGSFGVQVLCDEDDHNEVDFVYTDVDIDHFGTTKLKIYTGFDFLDEGSSVCNYMLALNAAVLSKKIYTREEEDVLRTIGFDETYVLIDKAEVGRPVAVMGYKRIESEGERAKNVFAVVIQGTNTDADILTDITDSWTGEMFGNCKDSVISEIKKCINERIKLSPEFVDDEDNYFLLTGHSLGGAVANAMSVDDDISAWTMSDKERIYTYTFEAPHTCVNLLWMNVAEMSNAYNFKDVDDAITHIPSYPGSTTYGKDITFSVNDLSAKVFKGLFSDASENSLRDYGETFSHHNIVGDIIYILQNGNLFEKDYYGKKIYPDKEDEPDVKADRYTVLVLDVSGPQTFEEKPNWMNLLGTKYTSDSSIESVKKAAGKLLEDAKRSIGTNKIAIVTYSSEAHVVVGFTSNIETLEGVLDEIEYEEDNRSIHAGLECAYELLDTVSEVDAIKNVLLCTTGLTDEGEYDYNGFYSGDTIASNWQNMGTEVKLYAYANKAVESAERIKNSGVNIYVTGIFDPIEANMPSLGGVRDVAKFLRMTAEDIASSEECFFAVHDFDELYFSFGELEENLTGSSLIKIYNDSGNYVSEEYSDDVGGSCHLAGHYEEFLWGPALFEVPSTELIRGDISSPDSINQNLAMLCGSLSTVAYNCNYLVQAYLDLGCKEEDIFLYSYPNSWYNRSDAKRNGKSGFAADDDLGFSIASRTMSVNGEETDILFIVFQGTHNLHEAREDVTMSPSVKLNDYYTWSWPYEFCVDAIAGLEDFSAAHPGFGDRKMKVVVTGHSLGGSAANLTAACLNIMCERHDVDYMRLSKDDIYAYTFGALDTITDIVPWDNSYHKRIPVIEGFENIINIYNLLDNFAPGTFYGDALSGQKGVGKYGEFYFFENDMEGYYKPVKPEENLQVQHGIVGYLQVVRNGQLSNDGYYGRRRVKIACPVDVEVICEGRTLCLIRNDKIEVESPLVNACVCEGEKTILLPPELEVEVKINATDHGTMNCTFQDMGPIHQQTVIFENIALDKGKLMETVLQDELTDVAVELFCVSEDGEKLSKIMTDGSEVDLIVKDEPNSNNDSEPADENRSKDREEVNEETTQDIRPTIEANDLPDINDDIVSNQSDNGSGYLLLFIGIGVVALVLSVVVVVLMKKSKTKNIRIE